MGIVFGVWQEPGREVTDVRILPKSVNLRPSKAYRDRYGIEIYNVYEGNVYFALYIQTVRKEGNTEHIIWGADLLSRIKH